jgi:ureidoglycolate dehydrogenase (NAD+)
MSEIQLAAAEGLQRFCAGCFEASGMTEQASAIGARVLVRTTLRGVDTHGVHMLPDYLKRLREGGINPSARPSVVRETVATALLDGDGGLGQWVTTEATELAIRKAREAGSATVLVRNSTHFGAAGVYALACAEAGTIGFIYTNGVLSISVTGGKGPALSSGTRAFGVPNRGAPIVLDISMGPAGTKILTAADRGESIPEGWLVDAEGRPTTDPREYLRGGARVPIGDHKGYGMALVGELFAAGLSGSGLAWSIGAIPWRDDRPWNLGHAVIAVDVAAFMAPEEFQERVAEIVQRVRTSPLAPGSDRILVPGERAAEIEARRRAEGIPLDGRTWSKLTEAASVLGTAELLEAARI